MKYEESNVLIAEFMGQNFMRNIRYEHDPCDFYDNEGTPYQLNFHNSWDWLMPVVEKSLEKMNASEENANHFDKVMQSLLNVSIESTYKAVVEFIKWYNENK